MIAAWEEVAGRRSDEEWFLGKVKEVCDDLVRIAFWQRDNTKQGTYFPMQQRGEKTVPVKRVNIICKVLTT